jgi:hypothetical protein
MRSLFEIVCILLLIAYISALFVGAGVTAAGYYAGLEFNDDASRLLQ